MDRKERRELRLEVAAEAHQTFLKEVEHKAAEGVDRAEVVRERNFVARERRRRTIARPTRDLDPLERMVGPSLDYRDFPPNEIARRKGRPVARLHELQEGVVPYGFGTGFLVGPNILITNNHVFPSVEFAVNCGANFLYEKDGDNRTRNGHTYALRPDIFFYSFKDLDLTLVYVEEKPIDAGPNLTTLGQLQLIETRGKVIEGSPLSIIQYPLGENKKYAFEQNTVTLIDDDQGIIQYTTDTQQGSSGAPGFNDAWEVAVLHYTGVPSIVNGRWMTKTGKVWDKETMTENDILWVANAGKSISKIVAHLKGRQWSETDQSHVSSILMNSADPVLANNNHVNQPNERASMPPVNSENIAPQHGMIFNFYGPNTIHIGGSPASQALPGQVPAPLVAAEAKLRFDEDFRTRGGYDQNFLGFRVPVPSVAEARKIELYHAFGTNQPYLLKYHHFSIVMNKARRFLMWSAENVNYSNDVRDDRERSEFGSDSNSWRIDRRLPVQFQVTGEEFYDPATLVDKGHMVRRDDNVWADNADALRIEYANSDTFHYTNCTPQHEEFNRNAFGVQGLWGILENQIKKQLDTLDTNRDYGQKACVFSGPILDNDGDPEYNGIQYPLEFWKVFVINSASVGKLAYGFILSQKDKVEEFGLEEGLPRFNVAVRAMQRSLKTIEAQSGVVFDQALHVIDVLRNQADPTESLDRDMRNFVSAKSHVEL
jgi:endonuclease G